MKHCNKFYLPLGRKLEILSNKTGRKKDCPIVSNSCVIDNSTILELCGGGGQHEIKHIRIL